MGKAGDDKIREGRGGIATGSSPLVQPIHGLDQVDYLTNETLFEMTETSEHLLIIGGGPIGMEMAQAHVRLGVKVTVIEGAKALGRDDPEMAAIVLERLRGEGVEIAEDAMAKAVTQKDGVITVEAQDGRSFSGSHLLVAVGRKANMARLNLEAAGIETHKSGISGDASRKAPKQQG